MLVMRCIGFYSFLGNWNNIESFERAIVRHALASHGWKLDYYKDYSLAKLADVVAYKTDNIKSLSLADDLRRLDQKYS